MIQHPDDRRPPLSPQLALRVAMVGTFAFALFAIIFFRLWFLQVLSGNQYLAQASQNTTRDISIPAQRGEILDRHGNLLVDSRSATVVQVAVPDLPRSPHAREATLRRLSRVLGIPTRPKRCPVLHVGVKFEDQVDCMVDQQHAKLPYANVTIKKDVPQPVLLYLSERWQQFQGVEEPQVFIRHYPLGPFASQLLGTVGPVQPKELKYPQYRGVPNDAIVGQSGVEASYDQYLRGRNGAYRVEVDSLGNFTRYLAQRKPLSGNNLKLSLDESLQKAGEAALAEGVSRNPPSDAGAFVVLNPQNGEVLAMGSHPTYDPSLFAEPVIPEAKYKQLTDPASNYPLDNRAIAGAYPTGSTFKPITSVAALESGSWSLGQTFDDTGTFHIGIETLHNAGHAANGVLNLVSALKVSSDIFFYNLGGQMNVDKPQGGPLQQWARSFGIGRPTGIDVAGEASGVLPTPLWRKQRDALQLKTYHTICCQIADGRPWSDGDNVNLAVGQGDLEASPLQLAVAYSAIANGGTIVRPHVGLEVDGTDGTPLQKIDPPPARHVSINSIYLQAVQEGLREAASSPGGTSADVFSNFAPPVYGKTGTAEHGTGQTDQAWYVCFVPAWNRHKSILVAVTVEKGGFGAVGAAPVARQILSQYFYGNRGPWVAGSSRTL